MYHLFRRIHLFTGLLLLVFIIMYFATGYVMIHEKWFGKKSSRTTVRTEALPNESQPSDEAMSRYLQETFALPGQRMAVKRHPDGSAQFSFARPGTTFDAVVAANGQAVTITRKDFNSVALNAALHRLHGYHGGGLYLLWACFYDLASAALILFALSGIYLWYKSTARRWPGFLCLAISFGFSTAMILYLMWTK